VWNGNVYGKIELGRGHSSVRVVCVDKGAWVLQECLLGHITYIQRVRCFGGYRNLLAVECAASNFRTI
jgi:hypothetical protein